MKPLSNRDIAFLKTLTAKAGAMGLRMQKKGLSVSRKEDDSIVTQADLALQDFIVANLRKRFRGIRLIYEEKKSYPSGNAGGELTAVIDPIDGTAVYTMGLPTWCVSLGLFYGCEPAYGFVFSPGSDMFFWNDHLHSYLNGRVLTADRKMPVDSETNIFYASGVEHEFKILFPGKIRNLGSTALHACLTADNARNRTLAFIGMSSLWDWAGAIPVILKAGGTVRYLSGRDVDYKEVFDNAFTFPEWLLSFSAEDFTSLQRIFVRM